MGDPRVLATGPQDSMLYSRAKLHRRRMRGQCRPPPLDPSMYQILILNHINVLAFRAAHHRPFHFTRPHSREIPRKKGTPEP